MMRRRNLLVPLLIVACGGPATVDATTTSAPTSTITTTTIPVTTTLGPEQVLEAFVDTLTDPTFSAEADLSMEIVFGDLTFAATGNSRMQGDDYHSVIELAGLERQETISVDGVKYERVDEGPWVSDEVKTSPFAPQASDAGPDLNLIAFLETLEGLEHQSTVEEEGMTLHLIGLPPGTPVNPVALGYQPDQPVEIELGFWARDDGSPHRMQFLITDASDPEGTFTTDLVMTFVELGGSIEISPPDDIWLRHHSSDLGYTIAHPRGWDVEEYRDDEFFPGDFFLGLDGTELDLYRTDLGADQEVALNALVAEFRSLVASDGMEPGETEEIEIADFPARLFNYRGDDGAGGEMLGIYAVTQTSPTAIFEFILFSGVSDPEGARQLMLDFLSTFEVVE